MGRRREGQKSEAAKTGRRRCKEGASSDICHPARHRALCGLGELGSGGRGTRGRRWVRWIAQRAGVRVSAPALRRCLAPCAGRAGCAGCAWCAWERAAPKAALGSLSLAGRGQNVGCVTERGVDAQTGAWLLGVAGWGRTDTLSAGMVDEGMEGVCLLCACVSVGECLRVWMRLVCVSGT